MEQPEAGVSRQMPPLSVAWLAQQHHGDLMRFLRIRGSGASMEPADLAQEAYLRMMQYEGARSIRSPLYLLLRVARNVVNDLRRADHARRNRSHLSIEGLELACGSPGPDRNAAQSEELARALAAIGALPRRCREIFLLHRCAQLSYPEIAQMCGISVKTVEKHVSAALFACNARLRD